MDTKTADMDMLHGRLLGKLLLFTLPIALSSIVQQLFSAADTAVVGYFGNGSALAAVGTNTEIIALIVTISSGLSVGANVLIAQHIGRNEAEQVPAAVQTVTTFTSQNHAAGQRERCRRILWLSLVSSVICSSVPIFMIVLFRNFFAGLFTPEAAVVESAGVRILCILLFEPLCNFYEIPAGVLRGSGRALYPAVSTMLGTCVFRIVWICTVFRAAPTLPLLYHAFPLSWAATILLVNLVFLTAGKKKPA